MDLIENDPLNICNSRAVIVQHLLQNLSSHDQARCVFVKLHIACKHTHIPELELKVSIFLVRERLNRGGVDGLGHMTA